jgi:hypothetical protein
MMVYMLLVVSLLALWEVRIGGILHVAAIKVCPVKPEVIIVKLVRNIFYTWFLGIVFYVRHF